MSELAVGRVLMMHSQLTCLFQYKETCNGVSKCSMLSCDHRNVHYGSSLEVRKREKFVSDSDDEFKRNLSSLEWSIRFYLFRESV